MEGWLGRKNMEQPRPKLVCNSHSLELGLSGGWLQPQLERGATPEGKSPLFSRDSSSNLDTPWPGYPAICEKYFFEEESKRAG
jgi:hypothetical protein